jgi:cytochrome c6
MCESAELIVSVNDTEGTFGNGPLVPKVRKVKGLSNRYAFPYLLPSFFLFFFFLFCEKSESSSLEKGEKIFEKNCSVCHQGGNNIIIAEKNLKKESLETNGMNSMDSISYQVRNGKNGMPAFGGRLKEEDISTIAYYVLFQSEKNFERNP